MAVKIGNGMLQNGVTSVTFCPNGVTFSVTFRLFAGFSGKSWVFTNFATLKSGEIWGILLH